MVDKDTILEKLTALKKHIKKLREIGKISESVFLGDEDIQQLAAFNLQTAIQNCVDIGSHIYAEFDNGTPGTYNEVFYGLADRKIISKPMLEKLVRMVGLRNRIAHDYGDVDQKKIRAIVKNDVGDFELFIKQIIKFAKI